jgi:predicted transcriptional regulator
MYTTASGSIAMVNKAAKAEVVTVRLDSRLRKRLDALAEVTDRSNSFLAAEAIESYLDLHEWQVAAIKEGVRQADAGEFAAPGAVQALMRRARNGR